MANDKPSKKPRLRKIETVREKAAKAQLDTGGRHRIRKAAGGAAKPFVTIWKWLKKEYHPVKLPDNKLGRFLTKRRGWVPRYFYNSWVEVRQVTWPGRRESWKLVLAVFTFATVFGISIAIVDYGLDKLFRKLILG